MSKFHTNPETGDTNKCTAKEGGCKFGSDAPHFESKAEAQNAYEVKMSSETFNASSRVIAPKDSLRRLPGDKLSYADNAKALKDRAILLREADEDVRILSSGAVGISSRWDDSSAIVVTFDTDDDQKIFLMKKNGEWMASFGFSPDPNIDKAKPFQEILTTDVIDQMARGNESYPYNPEADDHAPTAGRNVMFRVARLMEDHDSSTKPTVSLTPERSEIIEEARFEISNLSNGAVAVRHLDSDGTLKLQFVSEDWDSSDSEIVIRDRDGEVTGQMMLDDKPVDRETPIEKILTGYNLNYHAKIGNQSYPYNPTAVSDDEENSEIGDKIAERVRRLIELNSMSDEALKVRSRLLGKN
jgi:hypothetical protein